MKWPWVQAFAMGYSKRACRAACPWAERGAAQARPHLKGGVSTRWIADFLEKDVNQSQRRRCGLNRRHLLAAGAGLLTQPAWAQFRVEISGVGASQIPIGIVMFRGEPQVPVKISEIINADLLRSGRFKMVRSDGVIMDETTRPDMELWRNRSADDVAGGRVAVGGDGRYDVRYRLWDTVREQDLGGQGYRVQQKDLRLAAHRIADSIYEKLTGEKGIFATRIAYVTQQGRRYTLWVADADGANAQAALSSPESIISPTWSPDGGWLAYVSFEARKPVVYVHEIASGRRRLLANFKGSNSAPAWSPNGGQLAVTLSRDGSSQIYLINASGGEPRRLTQSPSIDTEPAFSPDGSTLYFVSDRGGAPQIYRMPIGGGSAQRVTFDGSYNVSPTLSPDGRWLAYIGRDGGGFRLKVMELASASVSVITDTSDDESPSFAPNSQMLLYATNGGRLMVSTLDGQVRTQLPVQGGKAMEPAWGPFTR